MRKFVETLAKRYIKNYNKLNNQNVRQKYGLMQGWVSIAGNIFIAVVKIVFGILLQSLALIADAIHTLSDVITSVVVIISFKMAAQEADAEHPFGHGRYEAISGVIVAVLLIVVGVEFGREAITRILNPKEVLFTWTGFVLVGVTLIVKELMARFAISMGDYIDSSALKADGMHHRTDAISTIIVVIGMLFYKFNWIPYITIKGEQMPVSIDGIVGLIVAGFIAYSGFEVLKEAIDPLLGQPPDEKLLKEIRKTATRRKQVIDCHDIVINRYGQTVVGSIHIEIPDSMHINDAHVLSEQVEADIEKKFGFHLTAHIDPVNRSHPQYKKVTALLHKLKKDDDRIYDVHDIRLVGTAKDFNIVFDLVPSKNFASEKYSVLKKEISSLIQKKYKNSGIVIEIEDRFSY